MTDPTLEAQSFHMLRVAEIAKQLFQRIRPNEPSGIFAIPSAQEVRADQPHLTSANKSGDSFQKQMGDIRTLVSSLAKSLAPLKEERDIFWHAPDRGRSWEESRQSFENLTAGVSDEKLRDLRSKLKAAIEKIETLQYGERPLTDKERSKLGLEKPLEGLRALDAELGKVERMRSPTVAPEDLKESSHKYRRCKELQGTSSTERTLLSHVFDEQGNRLRDAYLDPSTQRRYNAEDHRNGSGDILHPSRQQPLAAEHPSHSTPLPAQHQLRQPHAPRAAGVAAGVAMAATAGVAALATGATPAQAALLTGESAVSSIPGVGGRLAHNRHEAAVRDAVDAWGLTLTGVGAWLGGTLLGTAGTVVPVAGNAAGTAVGIAGGGILGNLIGTMGGDELLRLHARYILGQKDVTPSMGEQVISAALDAGKIGIDKLKPIITEAMQAMAAAQPSSAIDKQLTAQIAAMNEKGWGKVLGDRDGTLTLEELKAAFPKGFDFKSIDKDGNDISGKEITDALAALKKAGVQTAAPAPSPEVSPTRVAVAPTTNPQMRH